VRLEAGQRFRALRRSQFILKQLIFQPQLFDFRPQLAALLTCISQFEVVAEKSGGPASQALDRAGDWCHRGDSPDSHQRYVTIALDLPGEQYQLREDND
jgi:hypothetical protein